jgi:dTDP-4-dehydrorhamnose reductase
VGITGMIILIGRGYIGSAFNREMSARSINYISVSHKQVDGFWNAHQLLKEHRPELVINCAAFIPQPSVSLCDQHQEETIQGNVVLPSVLSAACEDQGIPFAHISTGCLWSDGKEHDESSPPQRAFTGHCGFYVGTKWLSEQEVRKSHKHYVWRVRIPFDQYDCDRNYLSKLARFPKVWDHNNSVSHRGDFVKACLGLWEVRAPFGTYNVMNRGCVRAVEIVERMINLGIRKDAPEIVKDQQGDCQLSVDKLRDVGVSMRHINDALEESLKNWTPCV